MLGGFIEGESVSSPAKSRLHVQTIRPVTIRQINESTLSDNGDNFKIDTPSGKVDVNQVSSHKGGM